MPREKINIPQTEGSLALKPKATATVKATEKKKVITPRKPKQVTKHSLSKGEVVIEIPIAELHPPEYHPFNINDDEAMMRLAESVKQYGVREPGLARPKPDGGYELLCGNRRKRACEIAEQTTMPVIIREAYARPYHHHRRTV